MNTTDLSHTSSIIHIYNRNHSNMNSSTSPSSASTSSASSSSSSSSLSLPNKTIQNNEGYLELILGPMFSGKTSTLKKIFDQCVYCNIPIMVIN